MLSLKATKLDSPCPDILSNNSVVYLAFFIFLKPYAFFCFVLICFTRGKFLPDSLSGNCIKSRNTLLIYITYCFILRHYNRKNVKT